MPLALTTAALSSAVLGASVTGTLSAFNASITNSSNTAIAGSLVMQETSDIGTVCLSSSGANNNYASCSGINKYGGTGTPFIPDATHSKSVFIENTGTTTVSSFRLTPDSCTKTGGDPASATSLCDSLQLTLTCTPVANGGTSGSASTVYSAQTLTAVANGGVVTLPASCTPLAQSGNRVRFDFSVHMPQGQDNTVQGQQVSQPLTWTFTGA